MATASARQKTTNRKPAKAVTSSTFVYKVTDKKGKAVQGETTGTSPAIIRAHLQKQGYIVKSVRKKPKPLFGTGGKRIKPGEIAVFSRQMATMMKAGVPLVQAFDIVADGVDNNSLKVLILDIRDDVASGTGFAPALRKHPRYFDDLFCNLVDAGEQAGALETMLDRIATYKEKTEALKSKIKKALTYPISVVIVAIIVTGILLVKVVPQFASTFAGFGADLPAFTQFVMGLSVLAQDWWLMAVIGIIAFVFLFKEAVRRSESFAYLVDKYMLKVPVIGDIL